MPTDPKLSDQQFIDAAYRLYHEEGFIEVDDVLGDSDEMVSRSAHLDSGDGAYVRAWVWVSNEKAAKEEGY